MHQNPTDLSHDSKPQPGLRRVLAVMSIVTLLMSIPQALTIWVGHHAAGVSIVTWSTYFASAVLWFWFGLRRGDKNIYLPCIGWMLVDSLVVLGAIIYG